jgi:hypothetical protein
LAKVQIHAQNCFVIIAKKYCRGINKFTWWIQQKICFQVYHFSSCLCWPGVLYTDPIVWLDVARLPPRYVYKYIKIKIAESYINNLTTWLQNYSAVEIAK